MSVVSLSVSVVSLLDDAPGTGLPAGEIIPAHPASPLAVEAEAARRIPEYHLP